MGGAEIACRALSVAVTLSLAKRLGTAGYGRIEFAFTIVFWLVLIVRDGFEGIASRELAAIHGWSGLWSTTCLRSRSRWRWPFTRG